MPAKVSNKCRDSKSDFDNLVRYVTERDEENDKKTQHDELDPSRNPSS